MTTTPQDARHLTLTTLDDLWDNRAPIQLPINGEPECQLQLDPENKTIRLVTDCSRPEPDVARFKNMSYAAYSSGDDDYAEIAVRVEGSAHGAYSLLADIADELQLRNVPLAVAVANAIGRHRDVIANRAGLTTEREIGLFGELLFLRFLIQTIGAEPALTAWHGPEAEEHDFVFDNVRIEAKSTSTERRKHVIHGLGQLVPVGDTPLMLLSIQITRGASTIGMTLPQLISKLRVQVSAHAVSFDSKLGGAGWTDDDADLYATAWQLRSDPRAYSVLDKFPALTADRLSGTIPSFSLVTDVHYTIDLSDMPHQSLPDPFSAFTK